MASKAQLSIHFDKRYPIEYRTYFPHKLFTATYDDQQERMSLFEAKLYNELLTIHHNDEANQDLLEYHFDIREFIDDVFFKNRNSAYVVRKMRKLQSRTFYCDADLAHLLFRKDQPLSFNPFPLIEYKSFLVKLHLSKELKVFLRTIQEHGYIKGDILALRTLSSEYAITLYWHIRVKQPWMYIWEIELKKLRAIFGLKEKEYSRQYDFFKRVLDPIKDEFSIHYVRFDYTVIEKDKNIFIRFEFANGPKDEKANDVVVKYEWERKLLNIGIKPMVLKKIQNLVHSESINEDGPGFRWSKEYIEDSLEAFEKGINVNKGTIRNRAGYLYSALFSMQWGEYHIQKCSERNNKIQTSLNFESELKSASSDTEQDMNSMSLSELDDLTSTSKESNNEREPLEDFKNVNIQSTTGGEHFTEATRETEQERQLSLKSFYEENKEELMEFYPTFEAFLKKQPR